jgi:hypothetical protein
MLQPIDHASDDAFRNSPSKQPGPDYDRLPDSDEHMSHSHSDERHLRESFAPNLEELRTRASEFFALLDKKYGSFTGREIFSAAFQGSDGPTDWKIVGESLRPRCQELAREKVQEHRDQFPRKWYSLPDSIRFLTYLPKLNYEADFGTIQLMEDCRAAGLVSSKHYPAVRNGRNTWYELTELGKDFRDIFESSGSESAKEL